MHVDDGGMPTATRRQETYDHRLKDFIHETGDIQLALRRGVPRSTARGWIGRSRKNVVTLDAFEATGDELRREVLLLRRRNEKLRAVLRILVTFVNVSSQSLTNFRVLDASKRKQFCEPSNAHGAPFPVAPRFGFWESPRRDSTRGGALKTVANSRRAPFARRARRID